MRRLLLPLVFLSFAAQAQDTGTVRDRLGDDPSAEDRYEAAEESGGGNEEEPSGGGTSGGDDVDFGGGSRNNEGAEAGATPPSAPESYTVQTGDTLWNLSQRFLNNPWYWPKIWSYNPNLDNPNWIRPGTVLRFYPGEAPVAVQPQPEEEEPSFDDIGEGGGFEGGLGERNDAGSDVRRREFFIPTDRLEEAGVLLNSPEEKQMLADSDRAYLKLKKEGQPGDVLQIFRKERELTHPVTGAAVGTIVVMVGEVRVDQKGKDQSLGTVISAWDVVERGQYVGVLPTTGDAVRRVDNSKSLKGYVVDAAPSPLSFLAESYTVVIDKGSSDGVQVGNTFHIVRAGDPYTREYSGMADEDVGELIVIETFKGSSTALLTAASRVIVPGDRIEMRTR